MIEIAAEGVARVLAVRDEDPQREWDALGPWWQDGHPGVIGIRDRRAGGAWLAADPGRRRLAVLLNRADVRGLPEDRTVSRGALVLDAVAGRAPSAADGSLPHHGFNLLEVSPSGARVLSWDGVLLRETPVPPGVHMIAHDDLDDPATARIARWLPVFRDRASQGLDWPEGWVDLLAETARLDPEDDRAIIRDNRPHGYPTQSLLYCVALVSPDGVVLRDEKLPHPGRWDR